MNLKKYIEELKRRQVIKVGISYLVVAWLLTQVMAIVLPTFNAPPYFLKTILFFLGLGFPLCLILAWIFEITPAGIIKTKTIDPDTPKSLQKSRRLNRIIIATLSLTVLLLLATNFSGDTPAGTPDGDSTRIALAVLAFDDLSVARDHEYFSDGMSTELTILLSKMKDITIRDRRSAFTFKNANATIRTIARELNVTHIIDGSVRTSGNDVRIDVQLIDARSGQYIWTQTFNRKMVNILEMQNDIANRIRRELKLKLLRETVVTAKINPRAYSLYLQADFLFNKNSTDALTDAIALLEQSLTIDSTHAPAYTLLARSLFNSALNHQSIPYKEGLSRARRAIEKALTLDSNHGLAYSQLARIDLSQNLDFESAKNNIRKALELDPNNAVILANAIVVKGFSGNLDNVVEDHRKLIALSPREFAYYGNMGISQYWVGDLEGALSSLKKYIYYYPNAPVGHFIMAKIYFEKGDYQKALEMAQKEPVAQARYMAKSFAYFGLGQHEKSRQYFDKFINKNDEMARASVAELYAYMGDRDNTLRYLEEAYELSDPELIELINFPVFRLVYGDPRWKALLIKMGLPASHHLFKYIT